MIDELRARHEKIVDKMNELKEIVDDETIPFYKRNQAAAKFLKMEKRYFPKIVHRGEDGTYRNPKEEN